MKEFFKSIDFISKEENLRIEKKNRYQNVVGGLISFLIFTLSIIITLYFFMEMLDSQDPKVLSSKGSDGDIHNYTLTKENLQFFISLEYSNATYYVDESIYTVTGKFTEIFFLEKNGEKLQKFKSKELTLKRCKDIYTQKDIKKYNLKMPIQYFYCIDPNDLTQIGGLWGSNYFSKVEIFVNKCKNETNKNPSKPCKSPDEINDIIDNGIVSMYASNFFIDNRDYKSPLKKTLKNNFDRLSNKFKMNYIITYSTNFYNNDKGWILPVYEEEKFPTIEDFKISQHFRDLDKIVQIQIQTSAIKYIYIRSYIKIQDVLTKIGGCIKALLLMGMAANFFYSYSFSLIDNLIKNHYDFLYENIQLYEITNLNRNQGNGITDKSNESENIQKKNRVDFNKEVILTKKKKGEYVKNTENNNINDKSLTLRKQEIERQNTLRNYLKRSKI